MPACTDASFSPEVHSFYGDGKSVTKRLAAIEDGTAGRRVYMFTVESANQAELALFEKSDAEAEVCTAMTWTGESLGTLPAVIGSSILSNKGVACIGEQTKALVNKHLTPLQRTENIPNPASPRAAFGHTLKKYSDEYIRTNAYFLC